MTNLEIDQNDIIATTEGFKLVRDCTAKEVFDHADSLTSDAQYYRSLAHDLRRDEEARKREIPKAREARLRRLAMDDGLMLVKSRRRDPNADDYGLYVLVNDSRGNRVARYGGQAAISAFQRGEGMTLDAVGAILEK